MKRDVIFEDKEEEMDMLGAADQVLEVSIPFLVFQVEKFLLFKGRERFFLIFGAKTVFSG